MITINDLEDKWNSINPYAHGYLLISGDHPVSFHIGFFGGEEKSFVVLNSGKIDGLISSKAITAECINTNEDEYILRFVLKYPSLDELFIKLCWDLIDSSRCSKSPIEKIIDRFSKWMRLMQKANDDMLSPFEQKGLLGELLYLYNELLIHDADQSILAWVGPEGSDQDFIFEEGWAEVKAISVSSNEVQISSLQQLDRPDDGVLAIFLIDKTTAKGTHTISLPSLILKILDLLHSEYLKDLFICKLAQSGYLVKDEKKYYSVYYHLTECKCYKVTREFPKLMSGNVPYAIVNAKYKLSLLAIENYRI